MRSYNTNPDRSLRDVSCCSHNNNALPKLHNRATNDLSGLFYDKIFLEEKLN